MKFEKLSENTLGLILPILFPYHRIESQYTVKHKSKNMRVDYSISDSSGGQTLIEFDGPTHYCDSKTQLRDLNLSDYCKARGIKLVRLPYFVQLNSEEIQYFFGLVGDDLFEYRSGFHDKKIVYPGNYNAYGYRLFNTQMSSYPSSINLEIRESLSKAIYSGVPSEVIWGC